MNRYRWGHSWKWWAGGRRFPGYGTGISWLMAALLCTVGVGRVRAADPPEARRGILDLRTTDLSGSTVLLAGEWRWYWHQLRAPSEPDVSTEYVTFPSLWSGNTWQGKPVPSQGYATYSLTVLMPQQVDSFALEVPGQFTSFRLFANGQELAHDGIPGKTAESTVPHWSTQLVSLPRADTVRLLLQVANFDHAKGGLFEPIELGQYDTLRSERNLTMALDMLLTGCMLMSSLFFLGLFSFNRHERSMLFFSLFCLIYSYRVIGTGTYVLHLLFPHVPWDVTLRLEYVTLYLSVASFGLYSQALYPKETHKRIVQALVGTCLLFAATVVLPPLLFTRLISYFQMLATVCLIYAIYVYWMAARRRRPGAIYSLMSTGVLMVVFALLLGNYFGLLVLPTALLTAGYLAFFFFQSLVLSYRFGHALNEARYTEKQFLANMSHEIRTPLNAILGFSTMLETTSLDSEQQEAVGFIRSAGRNLLTIVNDILDISKIEAGMLSLESIPFSLSALVDSLRTMMSPVATEKGLKLVVDIDPTLPAVVEGDPTRLTQILLNLLSNAIKFTKEGKVVVRIQPVGELNEVVRVRMTVQDTGIGMNADVLPHIFERFRQASDFTTRYYGGTGLGLNIVKTLVEMQGGWITVSSKVGEGSCFTIEIPYRKAAQQQEAVMGWTDDVPADDALPLHILIAEDNVMNQKLALQVLRRLGHVGTIAENGQQAIDLLRQRSFDLVLMDIQMPVKDGYTTTHQIRTELHNEVPIIAMTAHALASERERCLQAGMNDFLPKPFQINELQRVIRKYAPHAVQPVTAPVEQPQRPARPIPDFSLDQLLVAMDDDITFVTELLDIFLVQTQEEIEQIRTAMAQHDTALIKRVLHSQKGPIQTFGLTSVVEQNLVLETQLTAGHDLVALRPLIEQYLTTLEAELPIIQESLQEKSSRLASK